MHAVKSRPQPFALALLKFDDWLPDIHCANWSRSSQRSAIACGSYGL